MASRLEQIAQRLAAAMTLDEVVVTAIGKGLAWLGANGALLVMRDDDDLLQAVASCGILSGPRRYFVNLGVTNESPAGLAVLERAPYWPDAGEAPRTFFAWSTADRLSATAWIPVVLDGSVVAVLGISFSEISKLGEAERSFVDEVATLCGETIARLRGLAAEAPPASDDAARPLPSSISQTLGAAPLGCLVFDRELRLAQCNELAARWFGQPVERVGLRLGEAFPELAAAIGPSLAFVVSSGLALDRVPFRRGDDVEWASFEASIFPLRNDRGRRAGVAMVVRDETDRHLFEQERERAGRFAGLVSSIASRLAAARLPSEVLEVLSSDVVAAVGAVVADVSLLDAETRRLRLVVQSGLPKEQAARFSEYELDAPLPTRDVIATGRLVVIGSIAEHDARYPALRDVTVGEQSFAILPLISQGRPLGVAGLRWRDERTFSPAEINLLETIASLCSGALERARLHEAEHDAVAILQRSLLPAVLPRLAGMRLAGSYSPAGVAAAVGGDWYDAFELPSGRVGLVIGDVGGHGVGAAASMGQLRQLARAAAYAGSRPGEVLAVLNTAHREVARGESVLSTCCFGELDRENGTLLVANAGHLPPLLRSAGQSQLLELVPACPPLGVADAPTFSELTIEIDRSLDASIVMYTDGLIERRGEVLDDGLNRLRLALDCGPNNADDLCHFLLAQLAPVHQRDDIAVLVASLERSNP